MTLLDELTYAAQHLIAAHAKAKSRKRVAKEITGIFDLLLNIIKHVFG
jgi:hypothetical protein